MTRSADHPSNDNTYILGHSPTEMVRLTKQDRDFTRGMGGLVPELSDMSSIHSVLDVACGPGGWALELAQAYPHMHVIGIDIDEGMIDYADTQAHASGLDNVSFRVMNALHPLDFPNGSFDLVNARFLVGFLPPSAWSEVIQGFMRLLRAGGIVRLTEQEWTGTSSAAYEQAESFTVQAMRRAGQLLSPDVRHVGITPLLRRFLQQAGFVNIREVVHALNFSAGTAPQYSIAQDLWMGQFLLQSFQCAMGVTTQQETDALYQQMQMEMHDNDFYGMLFLLTAWGQKPLES